MKNIIAMTAIVACTLTLTACGGGGGDDSGNGTLSRADEGIWSNLNGGGQNDATQAVILSDGSYWGIYGLVGGPCNPAGILQGTASVNGSSVSGTYTDFSSVDLVTSAAISNGTYSGTVSAQHTLDLIFNEPSNTISTGLATWNGNMSYDSSYNQPASLPAVAGNYVGGGCETNPGGPALLPGQSPVPTLPIITISGSNLTLFSADGNTVMMNGTITPHGTVNVFDVSLTTTTGNYTSPYGYVTPYGQYGATNAPVPTGTTYKGILFQTSGSQTIEIVATAGNFGYFYEGIKQN